MADILANFSAALIFCYFFIKKKVGEERGLRFKSLRFKVAKTCAASLDGGTFEGLKV